MFQTRQIARAIYDEDYTKAVTMLLSIVEEQQKEIKELNLLSYIDDNVFNYVDPVKMMQIIEYLNKFDMLNGDPSAIISEITNKIKENKLNIE